MPDPTTSSMPAWTNWGVSVLPFILLLKKWCLYHFHEKKTNDPSGPTTESCYKLDGNGRPMAFPVSALREYLPTVEDASQRFGAGLAIFQFLDVPKAGGYNCVLRYCGQHGGHWNYIARTSRTASRRLREYDSRSMIAVAIVRPPDTFTERAVGEVELYRTETYEPVPHKDHAEAVAGTCRRRSVKRTKPSLLRKRRGLPRGARPLSPVPRGAAGGVRQRRGAKTKQRSLNFEDAR